MSLCMRFDQTNDKCRITMSGNSTGSPLVSTAKMRLEMYQFESNFTSMKSAEFLQQSSFGLMAIRRVGAGVLIEQTTSREWKFIDGNGSGVDWVESIRQDPPNYPPMENGSFLQQSSFSKAERRQKDTNSVPSDWNRRLHVWIDRIGWNVGRHQDSEASTIKAVISSTKFILTITCQAERQPEGDEAKRGLESQSQSLMMDRITFDLSLG